jgi:hypothetical protein
MVWFIVLTVLLLIGIAAYLYAVRFMAEAEVKQMPREDMAECHSGKHGPYPRRHGIVTDAYGTKEPVLICPFCYQEACARAKEGVGLKPNAQHQL